MAEFNVYIPRAHEKQREFIEHPAKRKIIRAGRRGGKTVGMSILAVREFLAGRRVLYATPTQEQIDTFWHHVKVALDEPITRGVYYKNETRHIIELAGTEQRIRAKTAWNADSLRGDYADVLILDEWQLMSEDAWDRVGAPMLADKDGDAVFIYTPPTLHSRSASKASDPRHAAKRYKLYKKLAVEEPGRYATFHFSSHENPHISQDAVQELAGDMSAMAYRMEIEAQDVDEVPGALWTMAILDGSRVRIMPECHRIVVGVDPQATSGQTGIVVVGVARHEGALHGYTLADYTTDPGVKPAEWGQAVVDAYHRFNADMIVGEINNGGDMVENTIRTVPGGMEVNYDTVTASRGKFTRAEPVAALFEEDMNRKKKARCHMVGKFPYLEDELISWVPGDNSPNRLDAMVWAYYEAIIKYTGGVSFAIARNSANLYGSRPQQKSLRRRSARWRRQRVH